MNRTLKILSGIMLLGLALPGRGQNAASLELNKSRSLWFNSDNAAGMTIDPLRDYNLVSASYTHTSGDYKSLQRGDKEDAAVFNTNGALGIGSIRLWGDFSFIYDYWTGTQYNTNRFFPSLDMPYYVADPNKGDWNKQRYDMTVKAAFPLFWNTLALGVRASYTTYKGAKQIDPRGVPIGYGIEVEPAVLVRLSDSHALGATFIYRNGFERNTFSNVQGNSTMVYLFKGLGNFSSGSVAGTGGVGNYYYPANTFGGSLQYSYINGNMKFLAEGGYRNEKIEVFQNPAIAYRMGTTDADRINAGMQFVWGKKHLHKLSADFSMTDIKGTEYLQEQTSGSEENKPYVVLATLDMSRYSHMETSASYDIFIRKGTVNDYIWHFGTDLEFLTRADRYNIPLSTFSYQNAAVRIHAKRNIVIKDRHRISLMAEGGYRYNIGGEYSYNGADKDHRVITEFYTSEHKMFTGDYAQAGWEAAYSYSFTESSISLDLHGIHQFAADGRSRTLIGAAISYYF